MDPAHIVVGGLTLVTIGLLVWIERRSRRNVARECGGVPAELPPAQPKTRT